MDSTPTPFDSDAPDGARRAIIRRNPDDLQEIEMVEATWGSNPRFSGGVEYRFVRSEGKIFPDHRCLVPASEFRIRNGDRQLRVTLDSGNFFYLAAIWEPAMGDWPLCYRVVTVAANAEVSRYQERQGAIIHRRQVMQWLDLTVLEEKLLLTQPANSFIVQEVGATPVQTALALCINYDGSVRGGASTGAALKHTAMATPNSARMRMLSTGDSPGREHPAPHFAG